MTPVHEAVLAVLGRRRRAVLPRARRPGRGPGHRTAADAGRASTRTASGRALRALSRVSDQAVAAAIWDLVWAGRLTNDTLAPLRTVLGRQVLAPGRGRRPSSRSTGAASGSGTGGGDQASGAAARRQPPASHPRGRSGARPPQPRRPGLGRGHALAAGPPTVSGRLVAAAAGRPRSDQAAARAGAVAARPARHRDPGARPPPSGYRAVSARCTRCCGPWRRPASAAAATSSRALARPSSRCQARWTGCARWPTPSRRSPPRPEPPADGLAVTAPGDGRSRAGTVAIPPVDTPARPGAAARAEAPVVVPRGGRSGQRLRRGAAVAAQAGRDRRAATGRAGRRALVVLVGGAARALRRARRQDAAVVDRPTRRCSAVRQGARRRRPRRRARQAHRGTRRRRRRLRLAARGGARGGGLPADTRAACACAASTWSWLPRASQPGASQEAARQRCAASPQAPPA